MGNEGRLRITPAVLKAVAEGDLVNALIEAILGSIEAQRAAGQPIKANCCGHNQLKEIGAIFGELIDGLFAGSQLPDGWKCEREPTHQPLYSYLSDERGNRRATIFHKSGLYYRNSEGIELEQRFAHGVEPECGWESEDFDSNSSPRIAVVRDRMVEGPKGQIIWRSKAVTVGQDKSVYAAVDELKPKALAWLDEHYPDWEDPLAYWDE